MSAQWNTALVGFMQTLGFGEFKTDASGSPSVNNIVIGDDRYILDIEELSDGRGITMALFRKMPAHELYDKAKKLLISCHYRKFLPLVVQVGLRGSDTIVLMVRVEQAWTESLTRAFDLMYKLYADTER